MSPRYTLMLVNNSHTFEKTILMPLGTFRLEQINFGDIGQGLVRGQKLPDIALIGLDDIQYCRCRQAGLGYIFMSPKIIIHAISLT